MLKMKNNILWVNIPKKGDTHAYDYKQNISLYCTWKSLVLITKKNLLMMIREMTDILEQTIHKTHKT